MLPEKYDNISFSFVSVFYIGTFQSCHKFLYSPWDFSIARNFLEAQERLGVD